MSRSPSYAPHPERTQDFENFGTLVAHLICDYPEANYCGLGLARCLFHRQAGKNSPIRSLLARLTGRILDRRLGQRGIQPPHYGWEPA
jgi:hypothetical protein